MLERWVEQNAKGQGELVATQQIPQVIKQKKLSDDKETIEKLKKEKFSDIIFLEDIDIDLYRFAMFFLSVPFEQFSDGRLKGKDWQKASDLCKWNGYKKSIFIPLINDLGTIWVNNIKEKK